MDYKEIVRRDGKKIVFCNLEELLMDFFGYKSMTEVEKELKGSEYICHCPFCKEEGHTKHKLYIKSDVSTGHCFVCTRAYIHISDQVDIGYKIPDFIPMLYNCNRGLEVKKLEHPEWSLDKFKYEFDDYDQKGVDYLIGRHIYMKELWKILDFKFLDGNVVMPFKYKGKVFYYQIRFTGKSKIKYFFPPISAKPPYIIEHGENKKFIICEGVYDAIALLIQAPEYTPFAVLGSNISDYQLEFLREYIPEEIIVYMDETKLSKGIAQKIKTKIDYCPIRIIKSNGEDPEEAMKKRIYSGQPLMWIKSEIEKQNNKNSLIPNVKSWIK